MAKILEENNYYPFGLRHTGHNDLEVTNNDWRYNGIEYEEAHDMYEMPLRQYDYHCTLDSY